MKVLNRLAICCAITIVSFFGQAQCPNTNTLFGDITPATTTPGDFAGVTNAWYGDYFTVSVCAGATYTFTTLDNTVNYDTYLTLYNNTGGPALAFNDDFDPSGSGVDLSQIVWTAPFTGTVRILLDNGAACGHTAAGPDVTLVCYMNGDCGVGTGSGACGTSVGTFTTTHGATPITPGTDVIYLCGTGTDCFSMISNDDYVLPPPASNNPFEVSELMFAIYDAPPPATPDPVNDVESTGLLWTAEDITECGNSGIPGVAGSSHLWFVPVTADDSDNNGDPNGVINIDQDGDGCYTAGAPLEVFFLPPMFLGTPSEDCNNGVVTINVQGGYPEYDGVSTYTITNNGAGTVINGAIGHNGYIVINGLSNGDTYDVTVDDGFGCSINTSGTYTACPCPTVDYSGLPASIACDGTPVDLFADVAVTPCYQVLTLPVNALAGNTIEAFEDGLSLWGGPLAQTPNTLSTQSFQQVDPSATNTFDLCEASVGTDMAYIVLDCHTGDLITSGTWVSDGGCQTITVTPPATNIDATGTWGGTGSAGLTTTAWGYAQFDPGAVGAGTWSVTYTWNGGDGCTGTATYNVTVTDPTPPTLTCPSNISVNNDASSCSASVAVPNPSMSDNCVIQDLTWTMTGAVTDASAATGINYVGTYSFPVGTTTVQYTADDGTNTTNCSFTVTVIDNENPTITCPANVTVNADAGTCAATGVALGSPVTADNCVVASTTNDAPASFPVGATTVTWTVSDGAGNTATCTQTVTVVDAENPVANCQNITVGLDATGNATITAAMIDNGSTDNCAITGMSLDVTSFTCADIGANTVTLTVTDAAGNTDNCTATVTVEDNLAPTAVCQNISVNLDATGNATITTGDIDNGSTDNCGIASMSLDVTAFTCADVGANTVTLTVTDAAGNTDNCTATVTIVDTENPVAVCQNITVNLDATGNATITTGDIDNGSTDNCAIASMSLDVTSFTCADIGANTVTLTVTDGSGNTDNCTATVTVVDAENPVAVCQNITVGLDATGNATITAGDIDNGSTDNCGIASMSLDVTSFTCADIGANTVTLTVTDAAGNTDNCTATVTVEDNLAPTAVCQNISVNLDATGNATITTGDIDNGSTDNCGIASMSLDVTAFTCADVGANTVTLTVTDAAGNTDNCTATVTIVDTENPVAVCQNITVNLDATGNATITTGDIDNGSTDNCAIASMSLDVTSFTCADIGANTVTLTVTDGSGNTDNCTATVTVTDPNVPTATVGSDATICDSDTYALGATSGGSATSGSWSSSLDGSFAPAATDPNAVYTPGPLATGAGSVVLTWTTDPSPCATASDDLTLTINPSPSFTVALNANPSACGASDGSIIISGLDPTTNYDMTYDSAGITINAGTITTDGSGDYIVTGLGSGSYNNWSITLNGCTTLVTTSIGLSDPSAPTFTVAIVQHPTSCGGTDGEIQISGLNGSTAYDITYDDDGTIVSLPGVTTDAGGNYNITGLDAGSYTTFVVSLAGCTGSDATVLVLTDPPAPTFTVALTSNPTSCGGADGSITISGLTPGTNYDISYDDDGVGVSLGTVTTDGAGNYVITGLDAGAYDNWAVTDGINCTGTDATIITLTDPGSPTFTVSLTSDPSICGASDGSITISGLMGSTTYDITYDDDGTPVTLTGVTTDGAGNYVITGLDAGSYDNWTVTLAGCVGTDATVITLTDPAPQTFTVTLTSDPSACGGTDGSITISGLTPSTTYDIGYDDDGTPVTLTGVTSDGAGNYVITGLDAGNYDNWMVTLLGCTGTDATVITLTDPGSPTFTVGGAVDPTTCGGTDGSITISGLLGSTTYDITYDDDGTPVTLTGVTTDGAGNYVITGLDAGDYDNWSVTLAGCTGNDATLITLTDPGSPTFTVGSAVDPTTCGGSDGSITISGLMASTSYDVTYDDDGTPVAITVTTDAAGNIVINGLDAGDYDNWTVTLIGCTGTDATVITLTDPGAPTFTVGSAVDPTTCGASDGSITISGLMASTSYDVTYDDDGAPVSITVTTDAAGNIVITGLDAGTYDNWIVSLLGCVGTDVTSITLTDPGTPTFTVSGSDPTTCGGTDGTLTFSGLSASTTYDVTYDDGSGPTTVSMTSDAAGDIIITGLGAGSYNGFVVTLSGCIGTDGSTITLSDPPAPGAPVTSGDVTYCDTDPINDLTATASSGGTLNWYSDAGLTTLEGTGTNFTPTGGVGSTTYYVNETANGCVGAATPVTVTVQTCVVLEVEIPTGFSPDNDGVNDVWEIPNLNILYPNCVVRVFNRWGNILFESNGYATEWDGTNNGQDLPVGSYFFTIDFGDDSVDDVTGSVTIIR